MNAGISAFCEFHKANAQQGLLIAAAVHQDRLELSREGICPLSPPSGVCAYA